MTTPRATSAPGDGRLAWYRLLQVSRLVLRQLDRQLDHEHRIGVNEFDVLITLDNAPGRRLRMTALAEAVMFSSGGLTRLVGRMEERGLVERVRDTDDGRSFQATLTAAGARRLADARVTHDAVIADLLASRLTTRQLDSLAGALARVVDDD
jgi:DNA-binding MarR family transcriptional regulator